MKIRRLLMLLTVCLTLGGCGLFSAEVTRPTEPAAPATAPAAEPTSEPATEPATVPVEDLPETAIVGQWNIDSHYTAEQGVGLRELYGSSIRGGDGMTFYGDGTFSYYAGACHGEGTYALDGDQIRIKLTKGDPALDTPLVIQNGDVLRIGMDQYGDGQLVWWTKAAQ